MHLCLALKPDEVDERHNPDVVVVLDIFFATTTIVTALDLGYQKVYPVATLDDYESHRIVVASPVLAVESALKPQVLSRFELRDVALSSSLPLALIPPPNPQSDLFLWSSNGTPTIKKFSKVSSVYLGSLRNISALVDQLRTQHRNEEILICCAGSRTGLSLEDSWTAGYLIETLKSERIFYNDNLRTINYALNLYLSMEKDQLLHQSDVAKKFKGNMINSNLVYSLEKDLSAAVPVLTNGTYLTGLA